MGIKDLLKFVLSQFLQKRKRIQEITSDGKTRGLVDFSSWQHKAQTTVAVALFENQSEHKDVIIKSVTQYFKTRIDILGREGVTKLHFVLDGASLPSKRSTEADRKSGRANASKAAEEKQQELSICRTTVNLQEYQQLCRKTIWREP